MPALQEQMCLRRSECITEPINDDQLAGRNDQFPVVGE